MFSHLSDVPDGRAGTGLWPLHGRAQGGGRAATGNRLPRDGGAKRSHDNISGPTFFKDCQHVDLQSVDFHADLKKTDDAGKTFIVSWAAILPPAANMPVTGAAIRGPPPDQTAFFPIRSDILLTTQRFRE